MTFPPGRMRNLTFALFGFGTPVGGTLGCMVIGMFIEWVEKGVLLLCVSRNVDLRLPSR